MADPIPKNDKPKIITMPSAADPDGPHGICWRSIGSQVVLAQVSTSSQFTPGPVQAQPIKIATEVPCIGERCSAWHRDLERCKLLLDSIEVQIYHDTKRRETFKK